MASEEEGVKCVDLDMEEQEHDYAKRNLSSLPNFELWSIVWTTLNSLPCFSGIPTTTFGASIVMCHFFLVGLGTCP